MLNPACTPGWTEPVEALPGVVLHTACCGCGWRDEGWTSKTKAKQAQRDHRFPPRKDQP